MRFTTLFFDLDDTLYPSSTGLWNAIKERMTLFMLERLAIPEADVPVLREQYFKMYGTTLRGLQERHNVDTEEYLAYVHDLPLQEYLVPNPVLREVIASLPTRNLIFTNADASQLAKGIIDKIWPPAADPNLKMQAQHEIEVILQQRENALVNATQEIIVAEMNQGDSYTKRARPTLVVQGLCSFF